MAKRQINIGKLSGISGQVNIATGNIVKNIRTIYQRSLTATEEAAKTRSVENKLLAEGIGLYLQRLQHQTKRREKNSSPYKGLLEYRLEDAETFFGRSTAIRELLAVMDRGPLTILHAESGAGKTSLLQAGVIPRIVAHGHLPLFLRPFNKPPSEALKRVFLPDLDQFPFLAKTSTRDFLSRVCKVLGAKTSIYILIDQFEEFFNNTDPKSQEDFINELGECLDDTSLNVHWLISLRSEYHGRLGNFQKRVRSIYKNDYLLNRLSRTEAFAAITEPANQSKVKFEKDLPERIINDLLRQNNEIDPPQLQLVCSALFEELKPRQKIVSQIIYEQTGCATGILKEHLERVLERLNPTQRSTAIQVLEELITSVQHRTVKSREKLYNSPLIHNIDKTVIETTINQLAESRLIRIDENDEGVTYELAHDYLLDEIRLTPEVVHRKQADEVLEQGLDNWKKHQLLLSPDTVKLIEKQKENIKINSEQAMLLFLSAAEYNQTPQTWLKFISAEDQNKLIAHYSQKKNIKKSGAGLWSLRGNLPLTQRARLIAYKGGVNLLWFSSKTGTYLLAMLLISLVVAIGINTTLDFKEWSPVENYFDQCLNGSKPLNPLAAIDAANDSHVVVYDPGTASLCESFDTGATWSLVNVDRLKNLTVYSITVNQRIYMLTDSNIARQTDNFEWEIIEFPNDLISSLREIAIAHDQKVIYAIGQSHEILKFDLIRHEWVEPLRLENITGPATHIAVNFHFLVVSTTDGIWYKDLTGKGDWTQFLYNLGDETTITAIEMVRPLRSWTRFLLNMGEDDWFLVLINKNIVYSGYLTDPRGLNPIRNIPTQFQPVSLAVNGYSKFATSKFDLFCEQSWTVLNAEWWKKRFGSKKPCQ